MLWVLKDASGGSTRSSLGCNTLCWELLLPPWGNGVHPGTDPGTPWTPGQAGRATDATHFWHSSSTKALGWSSPDMVITVSLSKAPRRLWSTVWRVMVEVV